MTSENQYISNTRVSMVTKLGRIVAHLDWLRPIKSHDPLITWSCLTSSNHYISTITVPMVTKLGRMRTYLEGLTTKKYKMLWSRGLAKSRDNWKSLYLYLKSTYGYQTWQDGDILWETPNHKVILRFNQVILQGHLTNKNHYISTTRVPMATK